MRTTSAARAGGFTIIELLTVMVVMGLLAGLAVPMMIGARRTVQADQIRTSVSQQIRTAADLVGADIRTAGERFPARSTLELLPIEIVPGADGESDEIILRRNLWEGTLPVCQEELSGSTANIIVAAPEAEVSDSLWLAHNQCIQPVPFVDGVPRNLEEIEELAATIVDDGVLRGFLWNSTLDDNAGAGEFFDFEVDGVNRRIRRVGGGSWSFTHERDDEPRIYVLEERRYRLRNGVMELIVNGDEDVPLRAVDGVTELQFRYLLDDGSVVDTLPSDTGWRSIRGITIDITASETMGQQGAERTLTSTFFPRNVLSR